MAYLIDRGRALAARDIVAAIAVRQRRVRSLVILRDNSLHRTLTRTTTLRRYLGIGSSGLVETGLRIRRAAKRHRIGATWPRRQ